MVLRFGIGMRIGYAVWYGDEDWIGAFGIGMRIG